MKRNRLIALLMASILSIGGLANAFAGSVLAEDADANPEDWPTYRVMTAFRPQHTDFNEMPIVDEILGEAQINIDWELVGDAGLIERKNLAISTGNMPDAILAMVNTEDVQENPELFMPLNEYIDTLPNVSKIMEENPQAKQFLRFPDGNIYSFPFVQEREYESFPDQLWINKEWLDNLGLEVPTNVEEYADVLRAFKNDDPNGNGEQDEIPMSMMVTHSYFGFYSLYGLFGRIDDPNHLTMEDKQVVFTADKDEWKEATKYFASLNAEGLLDPEGFTQDRSTLFAKGKTDPMILGASNAFLLDNVVGANRMESYVPVLLEGMNGEKTIRYSEYPIQSRTHSVVRADLENPEGLMRFFDVCLDESKHYPLQTTFGLIGKQIVEAEDGSDKQFDFAVAPDGLSQDDYRYKDAPSTFPVYLTADSWNNIGHAPDVARKEAIMEEWRPYLQEESLPPVIFTSEERDILADISSNIKSYVDQQQSLWITNQGDIDAEWDSYIETLNMMGLETFLSTYQDAVDRYFAE